MQRQPAYGEDDDDDDEDARGVQRALLDVGDARRGAAPGLQVAGRRARRLPQVAQHEQVEGRDDSERQDVGEDEEGHEQTPPHRCALHPAVRVDARRVAGRERLDAVDEEGWHIDEQHHPPDDPHRAADDPPGAPASRAARVYDRQVAHHRHQQQRVHRHVDRHVEQELRQLAHQVAERPVVGGEVVGDERDTDDEEEEVAAGEVQKQHVDRRPHGAPRTDDEDHHQVADRADDSDDAVEGGDGHLVEPEVKEKLTGAEAVRQGAARVTRVHGTPLHWLTTCRVHRQASGHRGNYRVPNTASPPPN